MVLALLALVPSPIRLVLAGVLLVGGMLLYDRFIDDPAVAREARRNFVHMSEKAALEASIELQSRLIEAERIAKANYKKELAQVRQEDAVEDERIQQEIADYEAKLEAAGRSCRLDRDDVDWLSKP